jgi:hypothetical protein
MKKSGIAIAALALVVTGFAQADSASGNAYVASLVPPGGRVLIPRQDCWIEHTQVQPARLADASAAGDPGGDGAIAWARTGKYAGSEHWNAALRRACRSQLMTGTSASRGRNDYPSQ